MREERLGDCGRIGRSALGEGERGGGSRISMLEGWYGMEEEERKLGEPSPKLPNRSSRLCRSK